VKVVVTGATGHIGTWVTWRLARAGHTVIAASRAGQTPKMPFGETSTGDRISTLAVDVSRDDAVRLLSEALHGGAALVHLAAWHPPATAATTATDRRRLLDVNVHGTMRVLEAARERASAVVYASTFEVYGEPSGAAITEASRVMPLTDYGATKLAGEDHLVSFGSEESIRTVALRFPAVYGPGETTSRALPNFLRAVARGELPSIQGDGQDLRDQIHVRDAARVVGLALDGAAGGIFNVSDGEPHSIEALARSALRVAGMTGEPSRSPRAKPRRDIHMSIELARQHLGFVPEVALEAGMAEQLAWLRAQPA
jgi:nucleoside-diphosphate-sugar epimerase